MWCCVDSTHIPNLIPVMASKMQHVICLHFDIWRFNFCGCTISKISPHHFHLIVRWYGAVHSIWVCAECSWYVDVAIVWSRLSNFYSALMCASGRYCLSFSRNSPASKPMSQMHSFFSMVIVIVIKQLIGWTKNNRNQSKLKYLHIILHCQWCLWDR